MRTQKMSKSSFSQWMAEQDESKSENHGQSSFPYFSSVFGQLSLIQDSVTNQFQDLSNSLPEAGMTVIFNYLRYFISNVELYFFIVFYIQGPCQQHFVHELFKLYI